MTRVCLVAAIAVTLALAGTAHAANASVSMRDVTFQPASVTVNVGESITWTNQDGIPHSAKADNGSFDTGVFSTGSRSVTFTSAGTTPYFCAVHPTVMRGTVRVLGAATPAPTPPPPPTPVPTPIPTPIRTAPPTAAPSVVTPPVTAEPTASPSPAATVSPSPTSSTTATPTASPAPVAVQTTLPPTPTPSGTTTTSRSDEGPGPLVAGAAALGVAALIGLAAYVLRRP